MSHFLKKLFRDRKGNALAIAAAAMPLVIGSAGLATDTVQWALWKRQLQRTADSGALAGVHAIVQGQNVNSAVTRDLAINSHVGITTNSTIENSPTVGAYTSDPYAVRVALSVQKKLGFSSLFLSVAPTINAVATATVVPHGKYCVISLEETATTGLSYTGNATVDLGCGMATNSRGAAAVYASGSSTVIASPLAAVGGIPNSSNFADGTMLRPYSMKQEDPFADVQPPAVPNPCANDPRRVSSDPAITLSGCFKGLTLNSDVTLTGEIIIDGGDFDIGAQANITCNGCVIILTNKSTNANAQIGTVKINGGATLNMSAPTSGTYAGILFYQDRRAQDGNSANNQNHINGNSSSFFQGAFYFSGQEVFMNGTSGMSTACVQMVARRVSFSGNTAINNSCPTDSGAGAFDGSMIRLVE